MRACCSSVSASSDVPKRIALSRKPFTVRKPSQVFALESENVIVAFRPSSSVPPASPTASVPHASVPLALARVPPLSVMSLLVLALKILGWKFLVKTIYAIFMLSLMLGVAQDIVTDENGKMIQLLGDQDFMSLIIGCCLTGTALAVVFLHNGSTGGTDIVAAIVNKYRNMSLGTVLIFVDLLIIGSSFPTFIFARDFTVTEALYKIVFGLCTMVVENFMLDYVMNSRRESVQFFIFSKKYQEIANAIGTEMNHGVTILDGHGWYTGQDMKVLCILARKRESVSIFRLIKMIDPNAFVSQSSVIGVYGEGFDEMKVKVKKKQQPQIES